MDRRAFMVAGGALLAASSAAPARNRLGDYAALETAIAGLEGQSGGRLGVAVRDTGTGSAFAHRGDERFAMCSTFKLLLAGEVLARGPRLDRSIAVTERDPIGHSPFTRTRVGGRATVAELCRAMTVLSDNGAANLMLAETGGPASLTRFLRSIGDGVTRLDRIEPELNSSIPGDARDTTSPHAMLATTEKLLLGRVLSAAARARLTGWLVECETGLTRLRGGVPQGWRAGDKTGTSDARAGSYNDVAIFWPPKRPPVLIASYLAEAKIDGEAANAVHAGVAKAAVAALGLA